MKPKKVTEEWLIETGYIYLGEYGCKCKDHPANQLWRWRDELIIYDPEEQRIVWSQFNEPRYQHGSGKTGDLHVGEREHK